MLQIPDQLIVLGFVGLLIAAAASDFRRFLIPNWIPVTVAALYPAHVLAAWAAGVPAVAWIASVLIAVTIFVAGILMFAAGMLGGGDVKLMSAVVLWAGPSLVLPFTFVTVLAGLVLALYVAARLCLGTARAEASGAGTLGFIAAGLANVRHAPLLKLTVPYGVAIAAGGMYVGLRLLAG